MRGTMKTEGLGRERMLEAGWSERALHGYRESWSSMVPGNRGARR